MLKFMAFTLASLAFTVIFSYAKADPLINDGSHLFQDDDFIIQQLHIASEPIEGFNYKYYDSMADVEIQKRVQELEASIDQMFFEEKLHGFVPDEYNVMNVCDRMGAWSHECNVATIRHNNNIPYGLSITPTDLD